MSAFLLGYPSFWLLKNSSSMKLSFIIPVYNEQKRIRKGLSTALDYLNAQTYSSELIIIDDGSTDKTSEIFNSFVAKVKHPRSSHGRKKKATFQTNIRIIHNGHNLGKGYAIREGVKSASGKYILFSDVDFSVPINFTQNFMSALKKNHVIIGSRRLKTSNVTKHQPTFRESLGQGFTKLSNLVLGLNHSDLTCGFKGFRAKVAKDLFAKQKVNRWAFDSEILFLAKKQGYSVKEIPVTWRDDPLTKVNIITDLVQSAFALLRIRFRWI